MTTTSNPAYKRVLIKFSGEALMGDQEFGIDPAIVKRVSVELKELIQFGVEVGVVVGGGNIFRGVSLAAEGMQRVTADQMGMLATIINALAMQDALENEGLQVRVMSALSAPEICEDYVRRRAVRHLEKGRIVIFAAGTGNPFFTTDSAASLRGVEIDANLVLKATKVDGVYSSDPLKNSSATRYAQLSYDEVLQKNLKVMDHTAIILCRDHNMPLRVYDMNKAGALMRIIQGENEGTLVQRGECA